MADKRPLQTLLSFTPTNATFRQSYLQNSILSVCQLPTSIIGRLSFKGVCDFGVGSPSSFRGVLESWSFGCCPLGVLGCNRPPYQSSSPKVRCCLIWELEIRQKLTLNICTVEFYVFKASLWPFIMWKSSLHFFLLMLDLNGKFY